MTVRPQSRRAVGATARRATSPLAAQRRAVLRATVSTYGCHPLELSRQPTEARRCFLTPGAGSPTAGAHEPPRHPPARTVLEMIKMSTPSSPPLRFLGMLLAAGGLPPWRRCLDRRRHGRRAQRGDGVQPADAASSRHPRTARGRCRRAADAGVRRPFAWARRLCWCRRLAAQPAGAAAGAAGAGNTAALLLPKRSPPSATWCWGWPSARRSEPDRRARRRRRAPLLLAGAVLLWVAGFDVLYALQDVHSIAAAGCTRFRRGSACAAPSRSSALFHLGTLVLLALLPRVYAPGWAPRIGSASPVRRAARRQHWVVRPATLSRLDAAFFTANGVLAVWLFAATALELATRRG